MGPAPERLGWDSARARRRLCELLHQGAILGLPTETLYGLSCVATDAGAVARLAALKGIASPRGFVALVDGVETLEAYLAAGQDRRAVEFLRRVWPAPLSAILTVQPGLPWGEEHGGRWTAAFRVPAHDTLQELLTDLGAPLVSTSANRTGDPPLTSAAEIASCFGAALSAVVPEHSRGAGQPSTLADFTGWPPVVRRAGCYDLAAALAAVQGEGSQD
jgi:L-threonylcarbamoyladenylate synthase